MLRQDMQQELHQNQETLAAREAEVAELKARVADLERLQAQQAQLIEMKDSEMAAVQERLASTSDAAPAPPVTEVAGGLPWLWIGLGLLVVVAVAWLLARRVPRAMPRPRFDSATLAAATPSRRPETEVEDAVAGPAPVPVTAAAPATPTWHAGAPAAAAVANGAATMASQPSAPVQDEARDAMDAAVIASLNPAPGGVERIELARAYIDLGDVDTARDLLREVADAGDPAARAEASRLLDGIA